MHSPATSLVDLAAGDGVGPFEITVSAAANERYWRAAGAAHPSLEAGALYPPIAANLTILAFGERCTDPVIQTRQRLVCHRVAQSGTPLVVTGEVTARYRKRDREYVDVTVHVATTDRPDEAVWTSEVTFTPVPPRARQ